MDSTRSFGQALGCSSVGAFKVTSDQVLIPLSKSTPTIGRAGKKISGSPEGIISAVVALKNSPLVASYLYLSDFWFPKVKKILLEMFQSSLTESSDPPPLGKLGLKLESAGKVRVFAMVDAWTQ